MGISNGQQGSSASCAFGKQRGGCLLSCASTAMPAMAQLGALQFGQLDARLPTGVHQEPVLLGPLSGFGFGGVWVGIGKCV